MVSPTVKRALMRITNLTLGLWLFAVLFAYLGVLKLTGIVADLAMVTLLMVIAGMIWKYAARPLMRLHRKQF